MKRHRTELRRLHLIVVYIAIYKDISEYSLLFKTILRFIHRDVNSTPSRWCGRAGWGINITASPTNYVNKVNGMAWIRMTVADNSGDEDDDDNDKQVR